MVVERGCVKKPPDFGSYIYTKGLDSMKPGSNETRFGEYNQVIRDMTLLDKRGKK